MKIVQYPIDKIKVAGFNPPKRTYPVSLEALKAQILAAGEILSPVHIGKDDILADGHRRVAVAKELGWETVPAILHPDTPADRLWVQLNAASMPLSAPQWLAAVYYGLPLDIELMPMSIRRRIENLSELLDREELSRLIELGRSPTIVDTARYVTRYCDRGNDPVFLKKTILWFIENQSQFSARRAIADECPTDLLIEAIEEGRSIHSQWSIE
jgi:hypothetical protein